ncbi:MAG: cupin domain-containing protein [Hydrogenibacillus schlegelii]|nr:cupin domain-containing protein [Hydrogenibacillus schlegelii]
MVKVVQTETLPGFSAGKLMLKPFSGERLMIVRVEGPKGALAPRHAHPHEQMTLILSGRVRFRIGEDQRELGPGEAIHIPSGIEHEAELLTDSVFIDIFHPVREDFLRKMVGTES